MNRTLRPFGSCALQRPRPYQACLPTVWGLRTHLRGPVDSIFATLLLTSTFHKDGDQLTQFVNTTSHFHLLKGGGPVDSIFQYYFSLSLPLGRVSFWLNFQYFYSLSLSIGKGTSWLWPATPTMEIHCQPSNGTNRASTSPLRWGAEHKDKKVTKSCPPDVFCCLWHTQCGKADHHSEQERQWHGV